MDPLLTLLQRDALAPREDIAAQLDITLEELQRRIGAYEADGVILGYQAIIDSEKISSDLVTAVIEVKITPEREGGFRPDGGPHCQI